MGSSHTPCMNCKDPGAEYSSVEFVEPKETNTHTEREVGSQEVMGQGVTLLRRMSIKTLRR